MKDSIQIIDPTKYKDWDSLVFSNPDSSFFHSSAWARVLSETYGYTPLYFAVVEGGNLLALLPVMEIKSFLTGKRGVSLPFTDYCEPLVSQGILFQDLLRYVKEYGEGHGWRFIELRGGQKYLPSGTASLTYLGHILDLERGEKELLLGFRDSTRRNIKKAVSKGVEVKILNSLDSVREFSRLNNLTRKDHGLPSQPSQFFKKVHEHILSRNLGHVFLALFQGEYIAGAIFFHLGEKAFYKYGASDKNIQHLSASNLLMWEAIKFYSSNGLKSLCFGRTEPEHKGLIQFKSGWGTELREIPYYRYNFKKERFVEASSRVNGFHNIIFRRMPIPILNMVSSILYKHIG